MILSEWILLHPELYFSIIQMPEKRKIININVLILLSVAWSMILLPAPGGSHGEFCHNCKTLRKGRVLVKCNSGVVWEDFQLLTLYIPIGNYLTVLNGMLMNMCYLQNVWCSSNSDALSHFGSAHSQDGLDIPLFGL